MNYTSGIRKGDDFSRKIREPEGMIPKNSCPLIKQPLYTNNLALQKGSSSLRGEGES